MNPFSTISYFAAESSNGNMFTSIGIDWKLLVLQTIAFLILFWFLKRFVYPPLVRMLDKHDEEVDAAHRAAVEAAKDAKESEDRVAALMKNARDEAREIVATAKEEATSMVADAETKAKEQADHVVANAQGEIQKEVIAAKKALHNETIDLVTAATEKVLGKTVDAKVDAKVISTAIDEAK